MAWTSTIGFKEAGRACKGACTSKHGAPGWSDTVPDPAFAGQPEFALDVDNVKPLGLVVGAAVALLLAGKPLSGSRGFGGLQYGLPRIGDVTAKVEQRRCMPLHACCTAAALRGSCRLHG